MTKKPKLGVFTGGGDCPGLNNAIKSIVLNADEEYAVEGLTEGWKGPILAALDKNTIETVTLPLGPIDVRQIDREGGTILMSSRKNPFNYEGNDVSDPVIKFLNERYHGVIVIGGEDTLGAAGKAAKKGLRAVGIPKTIDKDVCGTEQTLGFNSAVDFASHSLERLRYTAGSHGLTFFVEVMGRRAGHLTYWSGKAANVHFLTVPETEIKMEKLFESIAERKRGWKKKKGYSRDGLRYTIIAVAEGTKIEGVGEIKDGKKDDHGNIYLGGIADFLAKKYVETTGQEARALVLAHLQRGGLPSWYDRCLGRDLGIQAYELIKKEEFGRMMGVEGNSYRDVSLEVVVDRIRVLDVEKCYDKKKFQPLAKCPFFFHEVEVNKN